jgi:hypothetical protein
MRPAPAAARRTRGRVWLEDAMADQLGAMRRPGESYSGDGDQAEAEGASMTEPSFPQNFDLLHQHQEDLRRRTKEAVAASDALQRHFAAIEASMTMMEHFATSYPHNGEDELTIHLLGIRLFNSAAGALQSLTAGYYQNCVMLQRDILEVAFLLDCFHSNDASIAEWRGSTEKERNQKFGAYKVRTALDDRDGFTERKREEHYKRLCTLGAHASYQGFEFLRPTAGGDAHCGPYFADRALDATAAELAKLSVTAARTFTMFFDARSLVDYEVALSFMEVEVAWFEHFLGPFDKGQLGAMRALVALLRQR